MPSEIGIRELKNQTSAVLRRTRAGETITVTDRGRAVALLVPVGSATSEPSASDAAARVAALAAAGRVTWS
nr:type II toxin-antitoxin system prevent-host-death family antitoxin [Myxococcota bacterium]